MLDRILNNLFTLFTCIPLARVIFTKTRFLRWRFQQWSKTVVFGPYHTSIYIYSFFLSVQVCVQVLLCKLSIWFKEFCLLLIVETWLIVETFNGPCLGKNWPGALGMHWGHTRSHHESRMQRHRHRHERTYESWLLLPLMPWRVCTF